MVQEVIQHRGLDPCCTVEEISRKSDLVTKLGLSKLELKPLPINLRYEFLGPNESYPVIIGSHLDETQTSKLLEALRKHRSAIGYSIDDIKGLSPSICMHCILLEDGQKPTREPQQRQNPNMNEVVKKKVLKLLDAGIIFPISDSKWVSSVQIVPKKGGTIVIKGDNDELLQIRVVTG